MGMGTYDLLSEREREVLQLLAEGKSNKEAAAVLELSPHTVKKHRANLMKKLGLHNTTEIVHYAVSQRHHHTVIGRHPYYCGGQFGATP